MDGVSERHLRQDRPPTLELALAELATRQHGVLSLAQLRELGLGARAAQYRGVSGRLHRLHRGVYAVGHRVLSADGWRMAAVLACGVGAVLSHRSAAAAWGMRPSSRTRIDVTCQGSQRAGPPGIDLHRTKRLALPDDVTELRAIPITTVARTLVDLAAVLNENALERAVHKAEVLQLLDVTAVRAAIQRVPGRKGTRHLNKILSSPSPGPTRSELEDRFLELCKGGKLPTPRMNRHVQAAGRLIEADALWPDHRLVAELDSARFHRTARAFHDDRRRDAALIAQGYVVVRLTWERIAHEADAVLDELRRSLALRAPEFAA